MLSDTPKVCIEITYKFQYSQHGVNMPSLIRRKAICGDADLRCHHRLEFIVGDLKKGKQLSDQYANIALIYQSETEVKRSSSDTNVRITETVQNGVPMPLHSIGLDGYNFDQCVQCDITDVVIPVGQELSEYVDTENAETRIGLNVENGKNGFVENRVSNILR